MYLTMFRATKLETEINWGFEGMPALQIRLEDDSGETLSIKVYLAEGMQFCPDMVGDLIAAQPDLEVVERLQSQLNEQSHRHQASLNKRLLEIKMLREAAKAVDDARNAQEFWRIHKDDNAALGYLVNCIDKLAEALQQSGDAAGGGE